MKKTAATFLSAKEKGEKLALLTAYDYAGAKLVDGCGIDGILVGDSLGMVCLGYSDTLPVTMEDMLHHTKAVVRGTENALVIADMPFLSYHVSVEQAILNAGRLVKEGGAQAVKLEGGAGVAAQIRAIVDAQIPVMGHLGLTPQSVNRFGGFKVQGKSAEDAERILADAKIIEEAGAFAVVLECIPAELAKRITESLTIPTIGIGAGEGCDGQILVVSDMLGMGGEFRPKFVKVFEDVGELMKKGVGEYISEVKAGTFPEEKHTY